MFEARLKKFLIDVRTSSEYQRGHIANSINIPLSNIRDILRIAPDKNTLISVCCKSGMRSAQARDILLSMGYRNVTDIGGIGSYQLVQ
ncbi:MAG: rhodanese-like domain-containing protein [Defluviitaleaceae bacterium]|nr:rhodanese-like domain-containing protein [Defluviitaleaceae bacterium]